jgi:hypothetical protein
MLRFPVPELLNNIHRWFYVKLKALLSCDESGRTRRIQSLYEGASKILRTDAVKIVNLTTKHVYKLPTFTQLRATWHTDSLDMVVLPSTGTSRYHNWCIDGGISPEYFGYTLVHLKDLARKLNRIAKIKITTRWTVLGPSFVSCIVRQNTCSL